MAENQPTSYDPDHLLQVKNEILSLWAGLPPEHQASLALVIVAKVIDGGEYGDWLRGAIALTRPEEGREELDYPPL